jgi:uncharacterized protein (DUF2062 family)
MNFLLKYKPVTRLIATTKSLVFEGNSAHKLSLAITLGILFGILPFLGVTTLTLAILAVIFRLNMAIIQISNYMMYPIQVLLYIPFIRIGKYMGNLQSITATRVYAIMKENWIAGIEKLWVIHLWAILAWSIVALPTGYLIYFILNGWIGRLKIQMGKKL